LGCVLWGPLSAPPPGAAALMSVVLKECGLSFDRAKLAAVLQYSAPFVFSSLFAVVVNNADRFLLKAHASMADLGLYSLALKFGVLMQVLLLEPFHQGFGAFRFSIMNRADNKEILARVLKFALFGLLFLGLAVSLFAEPALRLLAAPEYRAAHRLVPVVVLGYTISGLTYFFQTGILYKKKTSYVFYITVVSGVTALAANALLIPRFEAAGAAGALVLRSVVTVAVTYAVSNRLYPLLCDRWQLAKMYIAAGALYAASRLLPASPLAVSLGGRNAVWLCFPVAVLLLGCVARQELADLGAWLSPAVGKIRGLVRGQQA
jgi:O-antigen/teichoic acid export membrane protein